MSPSLAAAESKAGAAQPVRRLRQSCSAFLRANPSIPPAAAFLSAATLLVAVALHATPALTLAAAGLLLCSAYVWGYCAHRSRQFQWAPLTHLSRRQYGEVWDTLMTGREVPRVAAEKVGNDEPLGPSTYDALRNLRELAGVAATDDVLEIGCGGARIGVPFAAQCRSWTGSDVSGRMLERAAANVATLGNVRLVLLDGAGLAQFGDASFDVVYATSTFGHLDEMDRWNYVREAFRVLRPGGRLLIDNIDIESDAGWSMFMRDVRLYQSIERPPYMPRFSTASELTNYARRAGFDAVTVSHRPPLLIVAAVKSRGLT